jgi:hypothetical protein
MMWQYTRRETKALLLATLLVFSGLGLMMGTSWEALHTDARSTTLTASSVGVVAAVEENPTGTLAAQLDARARELDAREAALAASGTDTRTLMIVSIMGAALLGLILLNFYLDTRRRYSLT